MRCNSSMQRELSFYKNLAIPKGMEFGFHKEYLAKCFDTMQNVGLRWFGCDGMSPYSFKGDDGARFLDYVRNECEKRSFQISSYHFASATFHENDSERKDIHKRYHDIVDFFSILKPKCFVMHAGWMADFLCDFNERYENMCRKYTEIEVKKRVSENVAYLADLLEEKGINLAVETMGNFYPIGTYSELEWILGEVKRKNLGICIDSGHLLAAGEDPADIIKKADNLLFETHFHDNMGVKKGKDMHLPVGFGATDWLSVQMALDDINYSGPVTFEVGGWMHQESDEKGLEKAIEWWREMEKTADYVRANMNKFYG